MRGERTPVSRRTRQPLRIGAGLCRELIVESRVVKRSGVGLAWRQVRDQMSASSLKPWFTNVDFQVHFAGHDDRGSQGGTRSQEIRSELDAAAMTAPDGLM
jgi:hypothetical protein